MSGAGTFRNLQDIIDSVDTMVDYLFNQQKSGVRVFPVVSPEFTNWRDEQHAWRESVALFDQSYHMTDLQIAGPDAEKLVLDLGINSPKGLEPGRAKQLVVCSPRGYVIGDGILFYLEKDRMQLVGRPSAHNWIEYHARTGGYDVTLERDEWSVSDPRRPRRTYRFQVQGPNAWALLEKLNGGPLPTPRFFHMGWIQIAGRRVRMLHHGMSGVAGAELFGPFEEGEAVKEAIMEAGQEFGLRHAGSRTYPSNTLESGWISGVLPAIYTGEDLRPYREWLPANCYEAVGSLGGSFYSTNIEDYYLTPWDLGYGSLLKFDHDFIGRDSLEEMADRPHRRKVTLVWNPRDVARAFESLFTMPPGQRAKYIDLPIARYAVWQYDKVLNEQGEVIGISTSCGYSSNEGAMLSLAMVDEAYSAPGTEVVLLWGEEGGGSRKPSVERHVQWEIRATVGPVPYSSAAREYRKALRG